MRIAYLMLCHKNPAQVWDLICQLNTEDVDFYVHIDKKSDNFELPQQSNIHIIPYTERVDVRWATISMVSATLVLARTALNADTHYDYFCLLSGQDFPIKSNREIQDFFALNNGANFIDIISKDSPMYRRFLKRNELFYPEWMVHRSSICKALKRVYMLLTGGYERTFLLFQRKLCREISFVFGSQWWGLSRECLLWIVDYLEKNEDFLRFFDNALTPDECVFQTVFMMSPFCDTARGKLTYLEWDVNGNNPRVLTKADYTTLADSSSLFARKFDRDRDDEIIRLLIDARRDKEQQ